MAGPISKKDEKFREYALNRPLLGVIMNVCIPLALYQAMQAIFSIIDALFASYIGSQAVSAIASITQITTMVTAIGSGLAVGGSIRISESYGMGDYGAVHRRVSTLYVTVIAAGLILALILVPFAGGFLSLLGTPDELVKEGAGYFRIQVLILAMSFFNTSYIAIERSRGHSRRLMLLNMLVIVVKLAFSALFIYVLRGGVMMIATATFLSQFVLCLIAVVSIIRDEGCFKPELKAADLKARTLMPIFKLSYPIAAEKMLFAAGKVIVNSMSGVYGAMTVGALGISNNIGGLTTQWHSGMHDGASALVSQSRGAGKYERTIGIWWRLLLIDLFIGLAGYLLVSFNLPMIAEIFARSKDKFDPAFCDMIVAIHRYEMIGYMTLGIASSVNAFLIGMGKAKTVMTLNIVRVFVFRVPVLFFLQRFTELGYEAVGITMMVSNVSAGLVSLIAVIPTLLKTYKRTKD